MSDVKEPAGSILTPSGWVSGRLSLAKGRIAAIHGKLHAHAAAPEPPYIVPGFIDLHVHGGQGGDSMDGEDSLRRMLRYHASHGTVAMAPTTVTAPMERIESALADIASVTGHRARGEATSLGAHIEGPFINPKRLGAQGPFTRDGDASLALAWATRFPIVIATVAPEIPDGIDVIRTLAEHRCRVQVGHSLASADQVGLAFACGCTGFTHLFNAMSGVNHRDPGVASWALAHAEYAEIICDLNHIHPQAILLARRAIPKLYTVTDSSCAAGMPDGEYRLGELRVFKRGLMVTLEDKVTLASSVITLADALRNLVSIGVPLAEAVAMASTRPAEYLGLADLGRIVPGARASLVALDDKLNVKSVWIEGEAIDVAA
jgi:N-acetylglucosamine-6-phosphate deacetylase